MPVGKWEFDETVTAVFDDMLARSIPEFKTMRAAVSDIACEFLPNGGVVLDAGCSRGGALAAVIARRPDCTAVGLEISEPMRQSAADRFKHDSNVTILRWDLRNGIPDQRVDVTLAVLTLQFTPIEYRQQIIGSIRERTNGPLILVEKVLGRGHQIDQKMVDLYYRMKRAHGYTQEQIDTKRHSLEGQLVPLTAAGNETLLKDCGYQSVDCFWRWMNFAAWIALP